MHFSFWPNVPNFQGEVQHTLLYWLQNWAYAHFHCFLSPLYGDEKIFHVVSSCCIIYWWVPLYLRFHLRFRRLFLVKPLKCVSDSKQFISPLSLTGSSKASSHMMKKQLLEFQSELNCILNWTTLRSQNPFNSFGCPGGEMLLLFRGWYKRRAEDPLCHWLISIISAIWMSFKLLAWSYLY